VPAHSICGLAATYNQGTHRGVPLRMNLTVNAKLPTSRVIHTLPLLIQGGGWGVVENRRDDQSPHHPLSPSS
jgi:hypothetical protein